MKTLILNGSPRPNGSTSYIVKKISEKISCDIIDSYFFNYSPCTDCAKCTHTGECIFNDGASKLIERLDEYDNIILASPLYFNQPTGSLLSLASRFQFLYNTKTKLRPKKGGIILVGGGDSIVNSADAEKTMRIILRLLNVNEFEYIRSLHTSMIAVESDETIGSQIDNLIEFLS